MDDATRIIERLDKGELNITEITNSEFHNLAKYAIKNNKTLNKYGNKIF